MTKLKTTFVAVLAALAAGAAGAAEVRVPVAGKSAAQIHADIVRAAADACWADLKGDPMARYIYPQCVRHSVDRAVAQVGDAKLTAYAEANTEKSVRLAAR